MPYSLMNTSYSKSLFTLQPFVISMYEYLLVERNWSDESRITWFNAGNRIMSQRTIQLQHCSKM